ncbi:hypothetical protein EB001_09720 [bacterium]|nr:hypothetical protein [bacterium]
MADISGLLDTLFLTKQNPELINLLGLSDEQKAALSTQQNIGTGVGAIKGALENWNQGIVPTLAGAYFGGATGRQAPVTNVIAQKKTAVDISKGLQELEKLGYDTRKLKREETGVQRMMLENANNPEALNYLLTNPSEYTKQAIGANPMFNKDVQPIVKAIGKPQSEWTQEDWNMYEGYVNRPLAADVAKTAPERANARFTTGASLPEPESREQYLARITKPIAATEVKPAAAPSLPKQPASEVKQGVPLIESSAITPKSREQLVLDQPKTTQATEYSLGVTRDIRNNIRRILDNPNLKDAFGTGGVLKSYIPSTEAANAAADLETLKNKLFVEGITAMRDASKTGAAVGNVTEKEGSRFENLRASLQQKKKYEDIVAELERLDKEMEITEKRVNGAYSRVYKPVDINKWLKR